MKTIAIGVVILALASGSAVAQTAVEREQILRDFQMSVADYTQRQQCPNTFPRALTTATPAPRIFTLPVAMVFRQAIASALTARPGAAAISGSSGHPHPVVFEPFPSTWLGPFPAALAEALPPLPAPLEYRLIGHDLVLRDAEADVIVGVLRDAVEPTAIRRHARLRH
jgi:hypothetical protein